MLNIAYIPMDERPCNYDFLFDASDIGNFNLKVPEKGMLGKFLIPGRIHEIKEWLISVKNADYLILSMDMLFYGGLIASREYGIDHLDVNSIRECLKGFRENNPRAKIYAFNIIMRTSISVKDEDTAKYWKYINEFSKLMEKEEYQVSIEKLKSLIPQNLLSNYLKVRKRNHANNNLSIKLVEEGIIDFLILGQEDCSQEGIHIGEQNKLNKRIQDSGLKGQALIMTGADELAQILLSRVLNDMTKIKCAKVIYDIESNRRVVSQFENLPLEETMNLHIRASNFDMENTGEEYIFYVATPRFYDSFIDDASAKPLSRGTLDVIENDNILEELILNNKVILFDLCHANGGCTTLMEFLRDKKLLKRLYGYTAWNTSSNSIGTGLMIYALHIFTEGKKLDRLYKFTMERILDDYIYQRIVRQKISSELCAKGENVFAFKFDSYKEELEELLKREIESYKPHLLTENIKDFSFDADFPWNRIFEIRINVETCL